jgi:cell division septation protein DedD
LALAQRAEAYREAGLNDLADADAKKSGRPAAQPAQNVAASQASTASLQRDSSPTPGLTSSGSNAKGAEPTGSGVSNFFTNLFGGKQAPPATRKQAEPQPASQASIGTAWSETTTAARSPTTPAQKEAVAPHEIPAAVKPATAKGQGFLVQAAAVRSRPEADAIAARLKKDQAAQLGGRAPEVDSTIIGNMGTFYRVRIGPYANANEPQALCAKLRGIGLDCLILAD